MPAKPTLHEIANLPHTQAVAAMREHYDPQWPMVTHDPNETDRCDWCDHCFPVDELTNGICPGCQESMEDDDG